MKATGNFVARHPKSLMSLMVALLAGTGVTAFGISPMAPDPSNLPKRIVSETIEPDNLSMQLEQLAFNTVHLYRSDTTRATDTAGTLLQRLGVDDLALASFLRTDPVGRQLLDGRSGKMIQARTSGNGQLEELIARGPATDSAQAYTHFTRLRIVRTQGKLKATVQTVPLTTQVKLGSGTIVSSLFAATDEAHIPDNIATQISDVFSTDIDFHRELQKGDTFTVVYEALTADGEPTTWNQAAGRLLAAEFVNDGKAYSGVWFKDGNGGKGAYYNLDGTSKQHEFLASPLAFSRITSGFAMRLHPITNNWRQHLGVDYGAPMGTPIRSVGDGTVIFAGWQNGYGNIVQVQHRGDRSTVYAHMSRILVKLGQHVDQGQRLGLVGMTGAATGPHLHFEYRVANQQQNPLTIAKAGDAIALSSDARPTFMALASSMKSQLDAAQSMGHAGAYVE